MFLLTVASSQTGARPSQRPVKEGPVALPQKIIQLEQRHFSTPHNPNQPWPTQFFIQEVVVIFLGIQCLACEANQSYQSIVKVTVDWSSGFTHLCVFVVWYLA